MPDAGLTLLYDEEVTGLHLRHARLVPGAREPLSLPIEPQLRLYLIAHDREPVLVTGPEDLAEHGLEVTSAEEAERFFDLFTGPETCLWFRPHIVMAVRPEGIDDRGAGTVPLGDAARLGIAAPTIRHDREFVSERSVVQFELSPRGVAPKVGTVVRRTERLSTDGRYALVEDERTGVLDLSRVRLPQFE